MGRNVRRLEWYARSGHARRPGSGKTRVDGSVACMVCSQPFVGRLFDPEVQLPLAGWLQRGLAWMCPRCKSKGVGDAPPRTKTYCFECRAPFPVPDANDEQRQAAGWRALGDQWVCVDCAKAIDEEDDGA